MVSTKTPQLSLFLVKNTKCFLIKIRRCDVLFHHFYSNYYTRDSSQGNKGRKKKGIHIVKEEAKLSSVVDDMNLHLENAEQSARKSTRTNNQV